MMSREYADVILNQCRIYEEALEEAARIAETYPRGTTSPQIGIAAAIRARFSDDEITDHGTGSITKED